MCLLPFSRHFLKTHCALSNYSFHSAPTQRSLHLSAIPVPLSLSLFSVSSQFSFSSVSVSLTLLLCLSLSRVPFTFCFSPSPSLPSEAHPGIFLCGCSPPGSLTLSYASFSVSVSLTACHPPSTLLLSLAVRSCYSVSVSLLPCLPSQCPLAPVIVSPSVSAHLSLPFPLLSPPSPHPHSLSPWEPSPLTETAPGQLCPKSAVSQSSHPR